MTLNEIVERVSEGGNLLANLALIKPETWEDSVQVFRAKDFGVITANMAIYRLVDGEAVFEMLGKESNPLMDETDETLREYAYGGTLREYVYDGILKNQFFFPQSPIKEQIKSAKSLVIVQVRYSGLRLETEGCDKNYAYVKFDGNNTDEEKKLFNGVYGTDNLCNGTKVHLLRGYVVDKQLRNKKDDFIVRACYFHDDQNFCAIARFINSYISAVRGVRRVEVAEGDAQKEQEVVTEEPKLVTEEQAVRYFTQNPVTTSDGAQVLSKVTNAFYQSRK
ncbi:hypothetical protein HY636_06115 [Candidatus Woesearchaeota archaeon]|nr:hypothetical protein [Candidatus Woesearchaeota archaeon]